MLAPKEIAYKFRVSYKTIMRLIKKGDLHAYRIGRHYKIPEESIDCYLNNKKLW
jgi:excisionase family DNA binding protein